MVHLKRGVAHLRQRFLSGASRFILQTVGSGVVRIASLVSGQGSCWNVKTIAFLRSPKPLNAG